MNQREIGRVAAILGAALTFFVGAISVVSGLTSSSSDQSGDSLVVRGLVLVALSAIAGHGAFLSLRKPDQAVLQLVMVAVLGSVAAFRSFWIAAAVLIIAAAVIYSNRER